MPTSDYSLISNIVDIVFKAKPRTILDIGIGFGKYGFLFREYLDIYGHTSIDEYNKSGWKTRIDGIEIFEPYILDHQKFIYSNIYIGDALELLDSLDEYDLIFIGDVLEHFSQKEGNAMIEKIKKMAKYVVIVVPLGKDWIQHESFGNKNEIHQGVYYKGDFNFAKLIRISKAEEGRNIGLFLYTNPIYSETKKLLERINLKDRNAISFHEVTIPITYRIYRKFQLFVNKTFF